DGADLATAGQDGAIRLWDAVQGTLLEQFDASPGSIAALRFTRGGAALVSGGGSPFRMIEWNPVDGTRTRNLTAFASAVNRVVYSDDSRWVAVAVTFDQKVEVFDAKSGQRLHSWKTGTETDDVAFSPDNRLVALPGANDTVVIRRLADGKKIRTLVGHQENVVGLKFSHDGSLLASGSFFPGTVRLWKTADWSQVEVIQGGSDLGAFGPFESISFSPDDTLLGTVAEAAPIVIRRADQFVVARPPVLSRAATFSPDGRSYVVGGDVDGQGVQVFETQGWTSTQTLPTGASDIAFSADGRRLLAAQVDGLRVWRTADWTVVDTWDQELGDPQSGQGVLAVAFEPDGARFAYGRADATLVVARNPKP
ncbi:MAG TPA: WD40 repeat domain-containing protein, partial [Burkholderiaceae bacterium]|nr:WD40 repeat domain-containing protein [Burkholderiaceae bacterium]